MTHVTAAARQRINQWQQDIQNFTQVKPAIELALQKVIKENYKRLMEDDTLPAIQIDIKIISQAFANTYSLKVTGHAAEFTKYAKNILQSYAGQMSTLSKQMEQLTKQLGKLPNGFAEQISSLSKLLKQAEESCVLNNTNPEILRSFVTDKLKPISEGLNKLQLLTKLDVEILRRDYEPIPMQQVKKKVEIIFGSLIDNALGTATIIDSSLQKIEQISNGLKQLKQGTASKAQIMLEEQELERAKSAYEKTYYEVETTLNSIDQGFQLAGFALNLFGRKDLAKQVTTVGQSGVAIAKSVIGLIAGNGLSAAVPLAGAVMSIFGIFGNQNSDGQQILQRLDNLEKHLESVITENIKKLANYMDQRFNQLETRLGKIENLLEEQHREVIQNFRELHKNIEKLQQTSQEMSKKIDDLSKQIDENSRELYKKSFEETRQEARRFRREVIEQQLSCNSELAKHRLIKLNNKFLFWISQGTKNKLVAGTQEGDVGQFWSTISLRPGLLESQINPIARFAHEKLGLSTQPTTLANPLLWAEATKEFIQYLDNTPEYRLTDYHQRCINEVRQLGEAINHFIYAIKTKATLFETLCEQYQTSLKQALWTCYQQVLGKEPTEQVSLTDAKKKLQALELSDIIIAELKRGLPKNHANPFTAPDELEVFPHVIKEAFLRLRVEFSKDSEFDKIFHNNDHKSWFYNTINYGYGHPGIAMVDPKSLQEARARYRQMHQELMDKQRTLTARANAAHFTPRTKTIARDCVILAVNESQAQNRYPNLELIEQAFSHLDSTLLEENLAKALAETSLQTALEQLSLAKKKLLCYVSLAFPNKLELLNKIQHQLWDKDAFDNYCKPVQNNRSFVTIFLQKEVCQAAQGIESELLSIAIKELDNRAKGHKLLGHPAVDEVLTLLDLFKVAHFDKTHQKTVDLKFDQAVLLLKAMHGNKAVYFSLKPYQLADNYTELGITKKDFQQQLSQNIDKISEFVIKQLQHDYQASKERIEKLKCYGEITSLQHHISYLENAEQQAIQKHIEDLIAKGKQVQPLNREGLIQYCKTHQDIICKPILSELQSYISILKEAKQALEDFLSSPTLIIDYINHGLDDKVIPLNLAIAWAKTFAEDKRIWLYEGQTTNISLGHACLQSNKAATKYDNDFIFDQRIGSYNKLNHETSPHKINQMNFMNGGYPGRMFASHKQPAGWGVTEAPSNPTSTVTFNNW